MTIRVLVVDDQVLVRTGFAALLATEEGICVVGEAGDGADAVRLTSVLLPDVVVMDIRMPVMDGVEATRRIVAAGGHTRVLVLTTFDHDDLVVAALRAGASGFLLKDAPADELGRAVRTVAAGDALLAPSLTRRLIERALERPATGGADRSARELVGRLTDRERSVLELIARGHTNAEIAGLTHVAETTVKTHVGRIFTKLGTRDRVGAVVIAYDAGVVRPAGA